MHFFFSVHVCVHVSALQHFRTECLLLFILDAWKPFLYLHSEDLSPTSLLHALRESHDDGAEEKCDRGGRAPPRPLPSVLVHTCRVEVRWMISIFIFPDWPSLKYSLIEETVTFMWVWMMCLLCKPEKVQVYVPECFSMSALCSRSDPSPSCSTSWSTSAWPSHRFNRCLVLASYLTMTVGSLDDVKVQVRVKFWMVCGVMQGMDSAWPSSCVMQSERQKIRIYFYLAEKKSPSLGKTYHHKTKTHTLIFPGGSPHLAPVSWCEGADVGVVGEATQSPQRALHVEETPVVRSFDGWVFHRLLGRLGFGGPGHPGSWVDVVRGAGGRLISHQHGHRLDES